MRPVAGGECGFQAANYQEEDLIIKKKLIMGQRTRSPCGFKGSYNYGNDSCLKTETNFDEPLKINESPKQPPITFLLQAVQRQRPTGQVF